MSQEMIVIVDFGGQYNQLIARRVRESNVYCVVKPYTTPFEELMALNPKGFIFTGVRTAFICRIHRTRIQEFSVGVFRFWAFATAVSC